MKLNITLTEGLRSPSDGDSGSELGSGGVVSSGDLEAVLHWLVYCNMGMSLSVGGLRVITLAEQCEDDRFLEAFLRLGEASGRFRNQTNPIHTEILLN